MPTGYIYDELFLEHDTGSGHPERAERLRAINQRLREKGMWDELAHLPFGPAPRERIERVHTRRYVERVFKACAASGPYVDTPDVTVSSRSAEAAQLAAGGILAAVEAVEKGEVDNAFCAVRPPSHHAERELAMGFCLFNHIVIAADDLIAERGYERVAIVDFDVHHGNGTQHMLEHRSDVLFISMHEHPYYLFPGTGFAHEQGVGDGEGFTLNIPLEPGAGDDRYRQVMQEQILPALEQFEPQFMIVSAGFDAAMTDPLAHMCVTPTGFEWITRQLKAVAQKYCQGKMVCSLEGGYELEALAESVARHVGVLAERAVAKRSAKV